MRVESAQLSIGWAVRRAFTLVELLVVVAVIVILIAILVPSMYHVRVSAMKAATSSELQSLRNGLQQYYNDLNMYPQSTPGYGFKANRGTAMLAEGLLGYLPFGPAGKGDGAGPTMATGSASPFPSDPAYGFRVGNPQLGGRIYGPYASTSAGTFNAATTAGDQAFIDPWGNEILYYRSTRSAAGVPLNTATTIFDVATSTTCLFYYTDCSTTQPSDPAFLGMLSASGTNTVSGGVTGSTNYLLISSGPPEYRAPAPAYFNSNNIVMSGDQ